VNSQSKYFESVLSSNLQLINCIGRGFTYNRNWTASPHKQQHTSDPNPLRAFFNARKQGRGIWKWDHYFDIYDRHFRGFRGREVHVLEIGVYSGGSLDMWRDYFGPSARLYGVDIEPACRSYESEAVKIFIGDQSDRGFWHRFRAQVPTLDIVIDDGGHHPEQQIATFEELLPHLRPGGIFLCEDVHGVFNPFASYMHGVVHKLNDFDQAKENTEDTNRRIACPTTPFQAAVGSVHFYPFVTVVERNVTPITELVAPKHGTQWQPHLK
jgi:SAM-dependent methyltransferase